MEGSLLAHIAGNFVSQYENVANSSVCYLLNRYPASRSALEKLLSLTDPPTHYVTERSTESNGRPDITGLDASGNTVVIIEGKFWANLTDNQPINYLKELGVGGKLLFLAPDRRQESLKAEIRKRLGEDDDRIQTCSWGAFLALVESENSKNHDGDLASDLTQLRALCDKMDEEGMPPLSMADLDPMIGRVTYQLVGVIDDCTKQLKEWDQADFKGLKSVSQKDGYGVYFRGCGYGCYLCLSSGDWFKRKSHTPIWLFIQTEDFKKDPLAYCTLADYEPDNAYEDGSKTLYGIVLHPGMDRHQVVQHIVSKVKSVLLELQSVSQGTPAE